MPASLSAIAAPAEAPRLGFYGKVPMRGDFLSRRLPRDFIDPWDQWLQEAIAASREQLGDDWLPAYLTAPIWRFVLGAGVCGGAAAIGVMMPSVDRVGRYFPLALALPLAQCRAPFRMMAAAQSWFAEVETLALAALDEAADLDGFEREVEALGAPAESTAEEMPLRLKDGAAFVEFDTAAPGEGAAALIDGILAGGGGRWTLWATTGSERMRPGMMAAMGLPPKEGFAAFLDGQWERWGWTTA